MKEIAAPSLKFKLMLQSVTSRTKLINMTGTFNFIIQLQVFPYRIPQQPNIVFFTQKWKVCFNITKNFTLVYDVYLVYLIRRVLNRR